MSQAPEQRHRDDGFSIIEVVISLTLMALILAALPNALRLSGRAWTTTQQLERSDALDAALTTIDGLLARAMTLYRANDDGTRGIVFSGQPTAVSFLTATSRGPQGGGLYRYEISSAQTGEGSNTLILKSGLVANLLQSAQSATLGDEHTLIENLATVSFRYFGTPSNAKPSLDEPLQSTWLTAWNDPTKLPELIEVEVSMTNADRLEQRTHVIELRLR